MVTAPQFDMSAAMGMIKPNPSRQPQVGTGAVAPMPQMPMFNSFAGKNAVPSATPNTGTTPRQ